MLQKDGCLQVRWVQADAIQSQLDSHNIVLLSNICAPSNFL